MNYRLISNLTGAVLLVEALMMVLSLVVSLILGSGDHMALLISALITIAVALPMRLIKPKTETLRARDGFTVVALGWLLVSLMGSLPFIISGAIPNFIDALFETVSGFTTTGATILTDVEALPRGLHFWRCFTHWAGGMGVLVLSMAIMPKMGSRSIHLMRAESPGPSVDKMVPRIGDNAKILYAIYLSLTALMFIVLMFCGLGWYDAAVHTFSTAGTGGFSIYADSIAHYPMFVQTVIGVFCMIFGINFALYFAIICRDYKAVRKNGELKLYLTIIVVSTVLIAMNILPIYGNRLTAFQHAYFQVSSVITTTGFASADYNTWPALSKMLIMLIMLTGCCAGSTGGGIKLIRIEVLCKVMAREVRRTVHPRSVSLIKVDGRVIEEETVNGVMAFFFVYMLILILSSVLVSFDSFVRDVSFEACFTGVIATLSNIGPGFGEVGPSGGFADFTSFSKLIFTFDMLIGRLELFPLLMFLSPKAWKN